ncbi:conserved hypothetical protein [Gammaproteobacteria bacterium]
MTLLFSAQPGCREAHLERRYKNPLFPKEGRRVTQEELNRARQADEADCVAFQEDLRILLREVIELPAHVESDPVLKLKERIEFLYETCAGLPGELSREREGLERLNHLIMQRIMAGATDDPYACWQLKQEEIARNLHWCALRQPLVAHLLRPDSPISSEDLVPTLLSESEESISAVMTILDQEQQNLLRLQARQWLERLQSGEEEVPAIAWQRLKVLEEC